MAAKPEILDVVVFPPITSPEKVFAPANVCVPVVTIPPLVPSADGTNGGIVTTGTQTFAGAKTFSGEVIGGNTTTSKISGFAANMNTQTGTTYQLTTGDNGKIITLNNSAGITRNSSGIV